MIRPATLIPIPVHRRASSRGSLEMIKILSCHTSPDKSDRVSRSMTPINRDRIDSINKDTANPIVIPDFFTVSTPFYFD